MALHPTLATIRLSRRWGTQIIGLLALDFWSKLLIRGKSCVKVFHPQDLSAVSQGEIVGFDLRRETEPPGRDNGAFSAEALLMASPIWGVGGWVWVGHTGLRGLPMDQALVDVFEQARKVVADADRKIAEEEERRRESERERLLLELGARIEEAFDFTSKEKLELEPRLDVQDGAGVVEFVVRSVRAIFLLSPNGLVSPKAGNTWILQVIEDGRAPQMLGEFQGGTKTEQASRRLAAARIVTMVGNWIQHVKGPQSVVPTTQQSQSPRWQLRDEPRPEPTYGTMGKFLGVSS